MFVNGTSQTLSGSTNNGSWLGVVSGANAFTLGALAFNNTHINFWNGLMGEVLIYNTLLSTANRNAVGAYLAKKWGTSGG
jgi:hypothetical protein